MDGDEIAQGFLVCLLLLAVGCLCCSIFASGKADYCIVQTANNHIGLSQHIPWRFDRWVANYESIPDALKAASLLGCPVK